MKTDTLYRKAMQGKRTVYEPVRECVEWDSLPAGFHLIQISPGQRSCTYNVEPYYAPVLAALRENRDALVKALREASAERPASRKLTKREREALAAYYAIAGDEARFTMTIPAAATAIDALEAAILARG